MTEQQQLSYHLLDLVLIFEYISDSMYPYQIPYNYTVEVTNRFKGLDLTECLENYGQRFLTWYRRL